MSTTVTYKGNVITTVDNNTRTLLTQDRWVEGNITLTDSSRGFDSETDPVFSASPAASITQSNITNWNNKSNFSGNYNDLTNKPTIPAAQVNADWDASSGVAQILNKPNLSLVAKTGSYNDLTNKPTIPTSISDLTNDSDYISTETDPVFLNSPAGGITANDILAWNNKSDFSGSYNDLTNKPTIPEQVNSDWNANSGVAKILNKPTLAEVATSGDYNDLINKPTIPEVSITSNVSSGTKIATVTIDSTDTDLYVPEELPTVTTSDNNKVLMVVSGAWAVSTLPIYNGGAS